jgi:prevent-host-death family protein
MTMVNKPHGERTVSAGEFKARCLKLMDEVAETGTPLVVTKRGNPVVRLLPARSIPDTLYGFMPGAFEVVGDIVETGELWEADG